MWATHFECLGTPSDSSDFDSDFLKRVNDSVKDIITACTDDLADTLSEPVTCGEISKVYFGITSGFPSVAIDYEHICFGNYSLRNTKDSLIAIRFLNHSNEV